MTPNLNLGPSNPYTQRDSYGRRVRVRPTKDRKPGSRTPFKHVIMLRRCIADIQDAHLVEHGAGKLLELQFKLAALPPYISRGHAHSPPVKVRGVLNRGLKDRSKYHPHQGPQECARRVVQMHGGWKRFGIWS